MEANFYSAVGAEQGRKASRGRGIPKESLFRCYSVDVWAPVHSRSVELVGA